MLSLKVVNVNEALPVGMMHLREEGVPFESRGMMTVEYPTPVATVYERPDQCVLFDPLRDANPFFHFFEALWILAGRRDVAPLAAFLPRIADFSDDGTVFHGAYGWRLRNAYGLDQLETVIRMLRSKPDTRRAVVSIYNPAADLSMDSKDIPCNDMIMFNIRHGALNMTVCNRSNDIIWGAYGANAVQFSFIMQYVAGRIGASLGTYTQISNSYHAYPDNPYWQATKHVKGVAFYDQYFCRGLDTVWAFMRDVSGSFTYECNRLIDNIATANPCLPTLQEPVLRDVALPMLRAFAYHKGGASGAAMDAALDIQADDWRIACRDWLERRIARRQAA